MSTSFSSRIRRGAKRALAALAILAVLCLATPSAFASVTLEFFAHDVGTGLDHGTMGAPIGLTAGVSNNFTLGNFGTTSDPVTVTSTDTDNPGANGSGSLTTTTIALNNTSATTDTLQIHITGLGFSAGTPGQTLRVNFSVGGSGGPTNTATDTTTAKSWADNTNAAFGTGFHITPDQTIVPTLSDPLTAPYTNGISSTLPFVLVTGPPFSLSQELDITLGAGDQANLTIITRAVTVVPEPSTMALAGLGALGFIGYRLRQRKARCA
jgi:hypothetical protein